MDKICTKCLFPKGKEQFAPHESYKDDYTTWCRTCLGLQASNWSKENAEQRRENQRNLNKRKPEAKQNSKLKQRYGISLIEFSEMSLKQQDRCLICDKHKSENKNGKLFVDHCYSTQKVRGLLCNDCNKGIGLFMDNPDLLMKAVEYLKANG